MMKDGKRWRPTRATFGISFEHKFYHTHWEDRAYELTVLIVPSVASFEGEGGEKCYWVGTSDANRWMEKITPPKLQD